MCLTPPDPHHHKEKCILISIPHMGKPGVIEVKSFALVDKAGNDSLDWSTELLTQRPRLCLWPQPLHQHHPIEIECEPQI